MSGMLIANQEALTIEPPDVRKPRRDFLGIVTIVFFLSTQNKGIGQQLCYRPTAILGFTVTGDNQGIVSQ